MVICDQCGAEVPRQDAPLMEGFPICRPCMGEMVHAGDITNVREVPAVLLGRSIFGELAPLPARWEWEYA